MRRATKVFLVTVERRKTKRGRLFGETSYRCPSFILAPVATRGVAELGPLNGHEKSIDFMGRLPRISIVNCNSPATKDKIQFMNWLVYAGHNRFLNE